AISGTRTTGCVGLSNAQLSLPVTTRTWSWIRRAVTSSAPPRKRSRASKQMGRTIDRHRAPHVPVATRWQHPLRPERPDRPRYPSTRDDLEAMDTTNTPLESRRPSCPEWSVEVRVSRAHYSVVRALPL